MRILLHYDAGPAWRRNVAALADKGLDVECCAEADEARFKLLLPETEVLWHLLRPVSAGDIARAPRLRLIQKIGIGVNTIDLDAARARGIAVCNMPGTNTQAVAEMTLLLMLACLRRLPLLDRATRAGQGWNFDAADQDSYGELGGRVIGLVGYGAVAQRLAPILTALGATVLYTATGPKPGVEGGFRPLDALLRAAQIVSLHLPLTPRTLGMIGRAQFALMRPGTILINAARGGLVDRAALLDALRDGTLAGAGLDVFAAEPVTPHDPLLRLDQVVLTPHLAWLTAETLRRSLAVAVENCRRLAAGEALLHRVA